MAKGVFNDIYASYNITEAHCNAIEVLYIVKMTKGFSWGIDRRTYSKEVNLVNLKILQNFLLSFLLF